ncbi:Complex III assembly factor LYRM7 [Merluccius polli]|uniref:Complex III assembly factor LYRM7 n=1 Tax=Merluccius polli TaxID=89951 RepID=A0AA47NX85_MERPO|nr:Complex III assembly factor LYRM7 [Merluccius polli]
MPGRDKDTDAADGPIFTSQDQCRNLKIGILSRILPWIIIHLILDISFTAARLKINEEFQKNKNEASEENIDKMIKMGSSVEIVLRKAVIQAEHIGEDRILLRPRESLLLENVPYSDEPRKRS